MISFGHLADAIDRFWQLWRQRVKLSLGMFRSQIAPLLPGWLLACLDRDLGIILT